MGPLCAPLPVVDEDVTADWPLCGNFATTLQPQLLWKRGMSSYAKYLLLDTIGSLAVQGRAGAPSLHAYHGRLKQGTLNLRV